MTDTTPATPTTEPTIKAAASTAVAAVESDFAKIVATVKSHAVVGVLSAIAGYAVHYLFKI